MEVRATNICQLGRIAMQYGDFDEAEDRFREALSIEEQLKRKEGITSALGNIGYVYRNRPDPVQARDYWKRSVVLYEQLGDSKIVTQLREALKWAYKNIPPC